MLTATQNTPTAPAMEGRPGAGPWAPIPASVAGQSARPPSWASAAWVASARCPLIAESLSAALGLERGQRVLDLGAGSGHIAISAGRRGCQVASVVSPDPAPYAQALLARDAESVAAERLTVDFWRWDIANVPCSDAEFDAVASSFAAMFEPDQEGMAGEMLRVCRPGGRLGVASWTPESFVGRLFQALGTHFPFAGDVASPFRWGSAEHVTDLFGGAAQKIDIAPRTFAFRFGSSQQCLDVWRSTYEPLRRVFEVADAETKAALIEAIRALIERYDIATDGSVCLRGDYLEVVVRKRSRPQQGYKH